MKGKITLLAGAAVGYVLGTRAGRDRYEQLKTQAQSLWQNPTVQEKKTQAQDFAKEKAPEVQEKVADAAASATAAAKDKIGKGDDKDSDTAAPYPTSASTGHA